MSKLSKIIGLLKKHGGTLVKKCAQGEEPMKSVLQMHEGSSNGICRTLVMKWMCERANGRDFWDWLAPGGKLSMGAVANETIQHVRVGLKDVSETYLSEDHKSGKPVFRDNVGSAAGMEDYMRFYGKLETSGLTFVKGKANHSVTTLAGKVPEEVGRIVRDEPPSGPSYLFAGMHGGGSGHALGVQTLGGGGIQYYDPNMGEATFDTVGHFADWMTAMGKLVYLKYSRLLYEWYNQ